MFIPEIRALVRGILCYAIVLEEKQQDPLLIDRFDLCLSGVFFHFFADNGYMVLFCLACVCLLRIVLVQKEIAHAIATVKNVSIIIRLRMSGRSVQGRTEWLKPLIVKR